MAEVATVAALTREQLNAFATECGVENAAGFPNKEALANEVAPRVSDEQVQEFVNRDPNQPPAPQNGGGEQAQEPAAPAEDEGEQIHVTTDAEQAAAQSPAPDSIQTEPEAPADPATNPAPSDAVNGDIEIGDDVVYPDDSMLDGKRVGAVTSLNDDQVEVVWRDGSRKWFNRNRVSKV
jgi:hypothetical protein